MPLTRPFGHTLSAAALCIAAPLALAADDTPPLDPRIDGSRITESDPPPLPARVVQPLPPEHRLAPAGEAPLDEDLEMRARAALARARAALLARQDASGGWMTDVRTSPTDVDRASPVAVATTAMILRALAQHDPAAIETEPFARGLAFIRASRRDDGAFEGGALTNYVTSIVVSALSAIDGDRFADDIADAKSWLVTAQWDVGEGLDARQDWYGGAGYGGHGRPDLSNTQMMLEALYDAGVSPDEPAVQRALAFVSRAQNLRTTNNAKWAGTDGGFVYTPANGGESMASEAAGEGRRGETMPEGAPPALRSYGSMTYAGFKSLLYAGLAPDDIRVRAAYDWIRRHWTFDENPGMGQQGLYYYYHAMSRALRVAQQRRVTDIGGVERDWRAELVRALLERQRDDGAWRNDADRWLENHEPLATAYAMLAIEETMKRAGPVE